MKKLFLRRNKKKKRDLMIKKLEKVSMALNYTELLLILVSAITGCVSISAFT